MIEIFRRSEGVRDNPYESRSAAGNAENALLQRPLYELTRESGTRRWSVRRIDGLFG
ncbi:hypothetical protein ACIA5G_36625 [Amycolatopsis sp. NPDC051758]|uniref:hypothetical protein n=1 Tax=Amycolatopsis sp. NPDC051758 TaxID=3363935 RepID=UPI0037BC6DD8